MSTSDTLKELQTTYETEKAQKDAEIAQLRDEVRNVHDYMYLCIYVYMYMYMYIYMCMYTYTCTRVCIIMCTCTCTCILSCTCIMYTCMYM